MAEDTRIPLKHRYAPTQSKKKVATMKKKNQPTKARHRFKKNVSRVYYLLALLCLLVYLVISQVCQIPNPIPDPQRRCILIY